MTVSAPELWIYGQGHIHTYRFIDGVWTFVLENAEFTCGADTVELKDEFVKIVACDAKNK